jgi:hypothetical protein
VDRAGLDGVPHAVHGRTGRRRMCANPPGMTDLGQE